MLRRACDADVDAWYFDELDAQNDVCRTESLTNRTVNIDYDCYGNVVGVEVL